MYIYTQKQTKKAMKNFKHNVTTLTESNQDKVVSEVSDLFETKNKTEVNHFSVQFWNDEEVTFECHSELGSHWVNVKLNGKRVLKSTLTTQKMKEWES